MNARKQPESVEEFYKVANIRTDEELAENRVPLGRSSSVGSSAKKRAVLQQNVNAHIGSENQRKSVVHQDEVGANSKVYSLDERLSKLLLNFKIIEQVKSQKKLAFGDVDAEKAIPVDLEAQNDAPVPQSASKKHSATKQSNIQPLNAMDSQVRFFSHSVFLVLHVL